MKKQQHLKLVTVVFAIGVIWLLAFFATKIFAATTPTLTTSSTYGILSSTYTDTSAATVVSGDVGFTTPPATAIGGVHTNYGSAAPYSSAGTDQGAVLTLLNAQTCDFTFGAAQDLSLLVQPLTAGVYCVTGAMSIGTGGITLLSGTYIFRSTGALNTVANSKVTGGNSCDVFWTPVATTLGENSLFVGTDIDPSGITVGSTVSWEGRALAFGGTVTTDTDTIVVPDCSVTPPTPPAATSTPPTPKPSPYGQNEQCAYGFNHETNQCIRTPESVWATTTSAVATTTATTTIIPKLPATGYPPHK